MDKPQIIVHSEKNVTFTLFDVKWIPCSAKFVVLGSYPRGTGAIQIYELSKGQINLISEVFWKNVFVIKAGNTTQWQADLAPKEMAASDMRNRRHVQPLLTWSTNAAHPVSLESLQEITQYMVCGQTEKSKPFKCGTFGASSLQQRSIATGDFDGRLHIWDVTDTELPVYSAKAHDQIINAIDGVGGLEVGSGAPEIVTGSRDGSVKVWDPRQKDDPVAIMEPRDGETRRDCWTVCFGNAYNNEERCVCAGYDNGDIKMFDLRNMSLRWETNIKNGVCGLEFDRKDICMNKMVATSLEGKFLLYDLRTQHSKKGFTSLTEKAHKSTIWTVRHLPQNREVFMTTGGNGSLCLWKYNYPESRTKEDGEGNAVGVVGSVSLLQNVMFSTQPISALDWSPDKQGLAVATSFDQNIRVVLVTKLNRNL
ncbi:WDR92 [Cordylochernes scorpioides]|uniref:WDR92 n=1 Tax=Cordylochernes scorpioides TaxID=51811 RepID=A0ABY6L339_9ARAC|nr:WDR92 [Cordylochernes scorpioides]